MKGQPPAMPREQMLRRICGEYLEMPGLQLTSKQAQRLWTLDEETCTQLLESLVEARFLRRIGTDTYARTTEGPVGMLPLRMAKAHLDPSLPEAHLIEGHARTAAKH